MCPKHHIAQSATIRAKSFIIEFHHRKSRMKKSHMNAIRFLARPLVAAPFLASGIDAALFPEAHRERAAKLFATARLSGFAKKYGVQLELSAHTTDTITRSTGTAMVAAGSLLALGKMPRLCAGILAAVQVPLALSNYPFWEKEGAEKRAALIGLLSAAGLAGGAILAAAATEKTTAATATSAKTTAAPPETTAASPDTSTAQSSSALSKHASEAKAAK